MFLFSRNFRVRKVKNLIPEKFYRIHPELHPLPNWLNKPQQNKCNYILSGSARDRCCLFIIMNIINITVHRKYRHFCVAVYTDETDDRVLKAQVMNERSHSQTQPQFGGEPTTPQSPSAERERLH